MRGPRKADCRAILQKIMFYDEKSDPANLPKSFPFVYFLVYELWSVFTPQRFGVHWHSHIQALSGNCVSGPNEKPGRLAKSTGKPTKEWRLLIFINISSFEASSYRIVEPLCSVEMRGCIERCGVVLLVFACRGGPAHWRQGAVSAPKQLDYGYATEYKKSVNENIS